jgi:hypothetical protein
MFQHDRPATLDPVDDHYYLGVPGWQLNRLAQRDRIRSNLSQIVRLTLTDQIEPDER